MQSLDLGNRLIYGSVPPAGSFINSDAQMALMMETIMLENNLQGRYTKKGEWVPGPLNIEGHLFKDKRRYALDSARLIPPEDISLTPNKLR